MQPVGRKILANEEHFRSGKWTDLPKASYMDERKILRMRAVPSPLRVTFKMELVLFPKFRSQNPVTLPVRNTVKRPSCAIRDLHRTA